VVSAAVTAGTRRAYGSYWNRLIGHWGERRLDEPTPSEIRQLMSYVKTHVVARRLPSTRRAVTDDRLAEICQAAADGGDDPGLDTLILRLHTEKPAGVAGRSPCGPRGRCASCGQQRRLVVPPGPAADTCADCAGLPVTHACADCGTEDKLYEKGRCVRCSLRGRTRQLLSDGAGIIAPQLTGVFYAVTAASQPRSALNWLREGAGASLLADVAAGRLAISHEALDAHPHRRAADYLRHMLTAAGALPPRDEDLARAGQWLAGVLDTKRRASNRPICSRRAPGAGSSGSNQIGHICAPVLELQDCPGRRERRAGPGRCASARDMSVVVAGETKALVSRSRRPGTGHRRPS